MNNAAVLKVEPKPLSELRQALKVPEVELSQLPAKLSKRLWVSPEEFLVVTSAPLLAQWALQVSGMWRPRLPEPSSRRGPKPVYLDWSVMLVALVQVAWQMGYEEVIDYFRGHPGAAQIAGFPVGGSGDQYRSVLGAAVGAGGAPLLVLVHWLCGPTGLPGGD